MRQLTTYALPNVVRLLSIHTLVCAMAAVAVPNLVLSAQGVQATRNLDRAISESNADVRDSIRVAVALESASLRDVLRSVINARTRVALEEAVSWADSIGLATSDDQRFLAHLRAYARNRNAVLQSVSTDNSALGDSIRATLGFERQKTGVTAAVVPNPAIAQRIPDVVFTLGGELYSGDDRNGGAIDVSTNLLGAAAGTLFDVIGSKPLQEYLKNNISAGAAIPLGSKTKVASQVGIGLGEFTVPFVGWTAWPLLGMEAVDSSDSRVPPSVVANRPKESTWASPVLAVAFTIQSLEKTTNRIACGEFVLIPTIGIRAPFYYPGDAFSAVAGLFGNKRSDFDRAGHVQYAVGVSLPLLRAAAVKPDKCSK
jgi:hypothetical protein